MRYSLESALPINAFSPRGRGPFAYGMTLEGGGGGGFDITDPIDWRGAGDALASIDPGPAIGQVGVEIDLSAPRDVVALDVGIGDPAVWIQHGRDDPPNRRIHRRVVRQVGKEIQDRLGHQ